MGKLRKLLEAPAKHFKYFAFALVLAVGAYSDYLVLFSSPAAVGLDGYYYVLQVDSLIKGGLFFSTRTPLIFYYLACISLVLGNTIIAIKVGTILLELLLCLGIGCFLIKVTKSWSLGILGAGYSALAGLHRFMIGEFVNNLGALSFIVATIFCLECARQSANKRRLWLSVSLLFFLFAIGSHRSAVFVFVAIGLAAAGGLALRKAAQERKIGILIALLGLFVVLYFSPYLVLVQPFIHFPDHLVRELSLKPRWPVTPYTIFDLVSVFWTAPLILATVIKKSWKGQTDQFHPLFPGLACFSVILNLSVFVNPELIAFGTLGRLQTLMYLQVALLVPYAIWLLGRTDRRHAIYATAFSIPLLILSMCTSLPPGLQPEYLRNREKLISALPGSVADIPPNSVIVAAHGEQFVITSLTGISAQKSLSQARADSTYWMLHQFPPSLFSPSMKSLRSRTDGSLSVLIRNDELWRLWPELSSGAQQRLIVNNLPLRQYLSER